MASNAVPGNLNMLPTWLIIAREVVALGSEVAPLVLEVVRAIKAGAEDSAAEKAANAAIVRREQAAAAAAYSASKRAGRH